ncbi:MAG: acyl--CoA ligase [Caulobacterales bacterium]|nr:acyl--CoA ligase [Caulobacterales bacterium]
MVTRRPIPGGWRDVATCLDRSVAERPDAEAIVGRFSRYAYAELDAAIDAGAAALAALGIGPGDRVAACAGNHPDIVIAFFAVQRLGAIWVGINRPLAAPEKAFQLADSGAAVFLADRAAQAQVEPLRGELPNLRRIVSLEPGPDGNAWLALVAQHRGAARPDVAIDPFAPAAIAYTSGTTGLPKGAVHSQHNMVLVAATTHAGLRGSHQRPDLRRGVTLPLTILNLMILEAIVPLSGGGSAVCMDRADALGIAEWVKAEKIQTFTGAPATVYDLLTRPEIAPQDLASLEYAASGGANVPDELRGLYQARFGKPLLGGYGLTEAPTAVAGTSLDTPFVPGACGRAFPHLKIAILDAQDRELAAGETGEICVRAADIGEWAGVYAPMLGYWGRPEETAEALRAGWLHTGDVGVLNAEGDIFIRDRLKEMIIRGGANIYPAEVERVLTADPRVRDAAVVGKPDPRLGEIVAAFVELAPGVAADEALRQALQAACAAQLAKYKIPEVWTFLDAMPRNAMNKIVKPRLKEMV